MTEHTPQSLTPPSTTRCCRTWARRWVVCGSGSTTTRGNGCPAEASGTASPAGASRPRNDAAATAGPSNAPWHGSPDADACTAATNARQTTSWPSPASPAPSSATADSPNEMTSWPASFPGQRRLHRFTRTSQVPSTPRPRSPSAKCRITSGHGPARTRPARARNTPPAGLASLTPPLHRFRRAQLPPGQRPDGRRSPWRRRVRIRRRRPPAAAATPAGGSRLPAPARAL